jgi:hypothetical protein
MILFDSVTTLIMLFILLIAITEAQIYTHTFLVID